VPPSDPDVPGGMNGVLEHTWNDSGLLNSGTQTLEGVQGICLRNKLVSVRSAVYLKIEFSVSTLKIHKLNG
jgi:hypothetical protein